MNPIGIISFKKYVSVSPQMVIAFFSAEKMLQNYNKYLTYTNNSAFFCIFAPYRTFGVLLACSTMRKTLQKYYKKSKGAKV